MKKYFWLFIVGGLNLVVAIYSIVPLIDNEEKTEWFGSGIYQILLLMGWVVFFLLIFLAGLLLKRTRHANRYGEFRKAFVISLFGTILIVMFGVIKHQTDFHRWQDKSYSRRSMEERTNAIKFVSTVDSLMNIIASSDSSLAEPFYKLGLTYRYNGDWNESVKNYKSAIALDQSVSSYYSELAYSESVLGEYDEAINSYERAFQLDSTRTWILDELRRCKNLQMARSRD